MKIIIYSLLTCSVMLLATTNSTTNTTPIESVNKVLIESKSLKIYETRNMLECPHLGNTMPMHTTDPDDIQRPEHCHTCSMGVYVQQFESNEFKCSYCNTLK